MRPYVKQFFKGVLIPVMAIPMFIFLLSFSLQAQSVPGKPVNVEVNWKKQKSSDCENNFPECKLTLTVIPSSQGGNPTSYHWEIWRLENIDYQKTTTGKTWAIGYIEPTDTYTVKVKAINAAGQSEQFIKVFNPPSGCCVK